MSKTYSHLGNIGLFALGLLLGVGTITVFLLLNQHGHSDVLSGEEEFIADISPDGELQITAVDEAEGNVDSTPSISINSVLKESGPFNRGLALHRFLSNATTAQIQRFFRQAEDFRPASLRNEIQEATIATLSLRNANEALTLLEDIPKTRRGTLISAVFSNLSNADINEIVALAQTLPESDKQHAVTGLLDGRIELSASELLEIAQQLDNEQVLVDAIAQSRLLEEIDDPVALWDEVLDEYGNNLEVLSDAQVQLLVHIAENLIGQMGIDSISSVYSSIRDDDSRVLLLSRLFQAFDGENAQYVNDLAHWLKSKDREVLIRSLSLWAKIDPLTALNTAIALELDGSSAMIQRSVLSAWMRSDPISLLENIDNIPTQLQDWNLEDVLISVARTSPDLVPNSLHRIQSDLGKELVTKNLAHIWGELDPRAAINWARSYARGTDQQFSLLQRVFAGIVRTDPDFALKTALQEPVWPGTNSGMEVNVIQEVAMTDPDKAIAMLAQTRNEETLNDARVGLGSVLLLNREFDRFMEFSRDLPEDVQYRYFSRHVIMWAHSNVEHLFEQWDNLPSEKIKIHVAEELKDIHALNNNSLLSAEQLEEIETYLND